MTMSPKWVRCLLIVLALSWAKQGIASSFHTSTKSCITTPCSTTGTTSFAVGFNQIVKWTANCDQAGSFYLSKTGPNSADILIANNLSQGPHSGEFYLDAANYFVSINSGSMAPGTYTIEYNREADVTVYPLDHDFLERNAGSASVDFTYSISLAGNDVDVTIESVESDEPHFTVQGFTSVTLKENGPRTTSFTVRFTPGTTPGSYQSNISIETSNPMGQSVPDKQAHAHGEVVSLEPDINCSAANCGAATLYGTADGFVGESIVFNVSFANEGNKVLDVMDISLTNNGGGVFSLNGAPNESDLAGGGTRNVSIHFAPPAGPDQVYCGAITITSDSPGEEIHECYFTARQHHREPEMVLESALLDYHQVEIGFTFTKAIRVTNAGDADLSLRLVIEDPSDPDISQWSENQTTAGEVLASGGERIYLQRFMPRALGDYTFRMLVEGSGGDGTYVASRTVTLTGAGTSPVPMDNVLVLDRSGSMFEYAGTRKKIEALQKAAMLYHDLLREDGGDGNGDRLGMAKYNHNNSVYHPLDYKNATNIPIVLDELSDAAISDVSRLGPDGTTSIGGALQRGAGMLVSSADSRKQIMVVMTDGKENTPPYIGDVLGGILADNADLMIYSIGLGDSIDPARLQSITNVGNGYHQVSEDLLGLNHFALEEFYFKIYVNASGADLIVDPTEAVDLSDGVPKIVQRATIVSSDRYAVFMVLDDPILSTLYTLEFVDPRGNILDPSSSIGGIPIQVMKRSGYAVYKIVFPDISQANSYTGDWILRLRPNKTWRPDIGKRLGLRYGADGEWINPYGGTVPVGFGAAVKSDYTMDVEVSPSGYEPGAVVTLKAYLADRGWPSPKGHVLIRATRPDGGEDYFELFDDGTHTDAVANDGTYSNTYDRTPMTGSYRFFFDGHGTNERGEMVPRQATRYVSLNAETPPSGGRDGRERCLPCWMQFLLVFLEIFIIWLIIRCCCRMRRDSAKR